MQFMPLGYYKTVGVLQAHRRRTAAANLAALREGVPIAVIDDEPLAAEVNLRNHGYKIVQIGDVKRIDEVKDYRIVLCDLMGVGKHFDESKQGAGIIQEIRANYPSTFVVAYSGSALNSGPARAAKEHADRVFRKDEDISEWRRLLDDFIQKAADPEIVWQRTRLRLTELNLDTKSILILEDAFVRSVLSGDQNASALSNGLGKIGVSADVRGIIQSLIASAIFKMMSM